MGRKESDGNPDMASMVVQDFGTLTQQVKNQEELLSKYQVGFGEVTLAGATEIIII